MHYFEQKISHGRGYIKMRGPCIIAFRLNLRPEFFVLRISPLVLEPKMLPHSCKTKRPTRLKASTRTQSLSCLLCRGPARRSTPTDPTATCIIGFLQEDEGEADLQWRRFQKMDLQWRPLPQGALGSCRMHHWFSLFFMLLRPRVK